ncbi:hypothetical protein IQ227_12760 [Anabaena aphanizomenioides LEGE 00250]|jgi:hypothetical protein|uniref:Uncharacterized protein n=1 Tax=Sphaerospermopsis aphanizomenoides LEGE 00250 TaxID=2777972 RepID=A0ABR9VFA2_9CYAN|nr:hypothetical protein [Sphaerospermopsis aphanizomenoides]MBE9236870.1 hypothetical protein [Sphaerospermopsis aphanizomenoides LEGE 00250]
MMNKLLLSTSVITTFVLLTTTSAKAERLFIYSPGDNQFLGDVGYNGSLCNENERDCIFNPVGIYGSEVGRFSIFNDVSYYGSSVGRYSVCNQIIRQKDAPVLIMELGNKWEMIDVLNIRYQQQTEIGRRLVFGACRDN